MSAASARIEVRVTPAVKAKIEHAAALDDSTVTNFVVQAAEQRAEAILRQRETHTVVPADFFDRLIASLDEADVASPALVKAVKRSRARARQF